MKKLTFALFAFMLAFSAHATKPGNNGGGNGGCGVGQTTNGCAPSGGAGGDGGTGIGVGVGVGVGIGQGGNASADVRSHNNNVNANTQGQHQGQMQGQLQGQQQSATSNSGGNRLVNEGNNSAQSTSVTVEGDSYRVPVSSALAPMIHNTANCAIGVSGGLQAATWGISGGSAYESDTCVTIEQSKRAESMGEVDVAREIMCSLPKYREARKTTGKPCSVDAKREVKQTASVEYTDPLIRRRLGLPPLSN